MEIKGQRENDKEKEGSLKKKGYDEYLWLYSIALIFHLLLQLQWFVQRGNNPNNSFPMYDLVVSIHL